MNRIEFYSTKAWKDNRVSFAINRHCTCERCHRSVYVDGVSDSSIPKEHRLKYIVHHKEYLNDINFTDDAIAFDWNNLELLCIDCHNNEHKQYATRKGLEFDEMGNLIQKY